MAMATDASLVGESLSFLTSLVRELEFLWQWQQN
jgi:hypothetical protein